jgi:myo-inositol-1(or 4)-monophosphatase
MDLDKITADVVKLVKTTGQFIASERTSFKRDKAEIKAKNDLVSYVDKESERRLVDGLKTIVPEAGFITEEETADEVKDFNWIIDPLDGTTNFIHGIPCYCICVALAKGSEILVGVVLEVARNECFYTHKNGESFMNDVVIHVSESDSLSDSLIATGFPVNNFEMMENYKQALEFFVKNTHGVRRIGAAAADLCYVACGRFEGFFEFNLKPWDVAAASLIVKNAGGTVSDFSGGENWLFGKEIVAFAPGIQHEFPAVIAKIFKRSTE